MLEPISIPDLVKWHQEQGRYFLYFKTIGYIWIEPSPEGFVLRVRPMKVHPTHPTPILAEANTAEKLAERAQQMFTTQHDKPVAHNTFQ